MTRCLCSVCCSMVKPRPDCDCSACGACCHPGDPAPLTTEEAAFLLDARDSRNLRLAAVR